MLTSKDLLALSFVLNQRIERMKIELDEDVETADGEDVNDLIHYQVLASKLDEMIKSEG